MIGGVYLVFVCNFFPNLKEVKIISFFGVLTTFIIVVISCVLGIVFLASEQYEMYREIHHFQDQKLYNLELLAGAFSVFSFAFGGHSLLPNFYAEMSETKDWWKSTNFSYNFVLFVLYVPMGVIGYLTYGPFLDSKDNILGILANEDFGGYTHYQLFYTLVQICAVLIIIHLLSVLPIISNPVNKKMVKIFSCGSQTTAGSILIRTTVIIILTLIAIFVPYFLLMIGLVSSISVVCDVYLFPVLFSWKIDPPQNYLLMIILGFIFLFGITGASIGLYTSITGILNNISGDPFKDMFVFTCTL
eukprot:TRINITY_DN5150_c0_g1_i2.p1 TRINITY_DN5150_c0_g1~~TRINITY_DN5150_c0_g1_i2.p1  ORF type:complete len:302 (-),score=22.06 TRINITY_DN5150_c0_g1_i2:39-944(-)